MSELKKCPFCGKEAKLVSMHIPFDCGHSKVAQCECGAWLNPKRWQSRPLEDALTARIAELEGALKKIAELENKWDAPNDFSNELQKIAQEVLK